MKKRAVYSIYIDVPEKEHYANASDMLLNKNDIKVKKTRDNFIAHYQKLLNNKKAIDVIILFFKTPYHFFSLQIYTYI